MINGRLSVFRTNLTRLVHQASEVVIRKIFDFEDYYLKKKYSLDLGGIIEKTRRQPEVPTPAIRQCVPDGFEMVEIIVSSSNEIQLHIFAYDGILPQNSPLTT